MFDLITCLFVFLFVNVLAEEGGNWHGFFWKTPSRFADAVFFFVFFQSKVVSFAEFRGVRIGGLSFSDF